ncbi:MAG: metallophosphoesterase [Bacillota bacterium]
MTKPGFALFIGIFIFIYTMLNFYIGLRGWQAFGGFIPRLSRRAYWAAFWLLALSYLAGRLGQEHLPDPVAYRMTYIGAYWLAAMYYSVLVLFVIDLVRLLDKGLGYLRLGFLPAALKQNPLAAPVAGFLVLTLVIGILAYGTWNARHPVVTRYELTVAKDAGPLRRLHVVVVSDIHLGEIMHNGRLVKMVDMINELKPDLVLLPGDVIDENIGPFVEQNMTETFRRLNPRFGIYAVPGNHEYIGGHIDEAVRYMEAAGIRILRDSYVKVADSFYVAGRDDRSRERMGSKSRQDLAGMLAGIDRSLPVIVLDHQPVRLEEAQQNGVDIQLSGHTHRGQLFPNQLITGRMYEKDWGLLRKGSLQVIVSSGFGTWGPPVRTGNQPELVDLVINFSGN